MALAQWIRRFQRIEINQIRISLTKHLIGNVLSTEITHKAKILNCHDFLMANVTFKMLGFLMLNEDFFVVKLTITVPGKHK